MQIGYMINNNLILLILLYSHLPLYKALLKLKKDLGKCKLHVNLLVILSIEALPGGDPMSLV